MANDSEEEDDVENLAPGIREDSFLGKLQSELPKMMEMIHSDSFENQLNATIRFRQILSREHNPPIDLVIQSGVIPTLVDFMKEGQPDMLQLEAAWALTNIASGTSDQTRVVVESGAVPCFVQLLYSQSLEVKEQAIWALGNVAGDSTTYRDYVLESGAMEPVLSLFNTTKMSLIQWSVVQQAIPTLAKLIYSVDAETLVDACWAVSYLSDGPSEAIQAVIDARIPQRLVDLLDHESTLVQTPALRAIGNIVTGNDMQTQAMINVGVLQHLAPLLNSPKETLRKEACWTISNITAGNAEQIQAVIDSNLIPPIVRLLAQGDYKTKKEACWAISMLLSVA
ncbi:hypothetical protein CJJ09_004536 [Candidozyma auris]|nr:hypothetical protein CJJ09_004536 [[Candida] auris]